jgi:hypothetical protein
MLAALSLLRHANDLGRVADDEDRRIGVVSLAFLIHGILSDVAERARA